MRAPCPGLNTLANHGYINRDGRNIDVEMVLQGFLDAFGMEFDVNRPGANNAIHTCTVVTGGDCATFDLWMLNHPHDIEHDGSVSRLDYNQIGNDAHNNFDFSQDIWGLTLAMWGGATHVGVNQASTAYQGRRSQAMNADQPGWFSDAQAGGAFTEHAFYLTTMNDPAVNPQMDANNVQARLDWVNHLFQQEELPTALGWVKPTATILNAYVQSVSGLVATATTVPPAAGTFYAEPTAAATADKRDVRARATAVAEPTTTQKNLLAQLLTNPTQSASAAAKYAQATAQAGPAPASYDAYRAPITDEMLAAVSTYVNSLQNAIKALFGDNFLNLDQLI